MIFTLLSLVGLELAVRALYSDVSTTGDNTSLFALRWRAKHPVKLNSLGFREREPASTHDGIFRVAVIGDSITYGQGIADSERFTNLLEERFRQSGQRAQVLNFGKPGAETVDHVDILRDSVLPLRPDFVLLQWYPNDAEGRDKSHRSRPMQLIPFGRVSLWFHHRSALYYLANARWRDVQMRLGWIDSYAETLVQHLGDESGSSAQAAQRALDEFLSITRDASIPAAIIVFPTFSEERRTFDFLIDRVIETCQRWEIPCFDLRSRFATVAPVQKLRLNRLDGHPGPLANRMAADELWEFFARPQRPLAP